MEWGFAYLALGALVGLLGGMFGIGGGTILVPVLLYFFQIQNFPADHAMHMALGSAMAAILFTSLSSMYKHHQHGMVSWPAVYTYFIAHAWHLFFFFCMFYSNTNLA